MFGFLAQSFYFLDLFALLFSSEVFGAFVYPCLCQCSPLHEQKNEISHPANTIRNTTPISESIAPLKYDFAVNTSDAITATTIRMNKSANNPWMVGELCHLQQPQSQASADLDPLVLFLLGIVSTNSIGIISSINAFKPIV
jgi:hypothetical protein